MLIENQYFFQPFHFNKHLIYWLKGLVLPRGLKFMIPVLKIKISSMLQNKNFLNKKCPSNSKKADH